MRLSPAVKSIGRTFARKDPLFFHILTQYLPRRKCLSPSGDMSVRSTRSTPGSALWVKLLRIYLDLFIARCTLLLPIQKAILCYQLSRSWAIMPRRGSISATMFFTAEPLPLPPKKARQRAPRPYRFTIKPGTFFVGLKIIPTTHIANRIRYAQPIHLPPGSACACRRIH